MKSNIERIIERLCIVGLLTLRLTSEDSNQLKINLHIQNFDDVVDDDDGDEKKNENAQKLRVSSPHCH
jgi:hypothetical protein